MISPDENEEVRRGIKHFTYIYTARREILVNGSHVCIQGTRLTTVLSFIKGHTFKSIESQLSW